MPQSVKDIFENGAKPRDYSISVPERPELEEMLNAPVPGDFPEAELANLPEEVPVIQPLLKEDLRHLLTMEAAQIMSKQTGEDVFAAYDRLKQTPDSRGALAAGALSKVQSEQRQAKLDMASDISGESPDLSVARAKETQMILDELNKQNSNPHLAFVKAISTEEVTPETEQKLANELAVLEMIRGITDSMGIMDKALAIGGLVMPLNTVKDNMDIAGNPFEAKEFLKQLILKYKTASPAQQKEMLPELQTFLFEKADNPYKVVEVLNALITPGGEEHLVAFDNLFVGMELAELATFGATAALKIAKITKQLNAIKTLNRAGNKEAASQLNTATVLDPKMRKELGLDEVEVYNNSSPFNLSELDDAYTEGLSPETLKDLAAFDRKSDELKSQISNDELFLREGLMDQEDRIRVEEAAVKELEKEPYVTDVRLAKQSEAESIFVYRNTKTGKDEAYTLELSLNDIGQYEQSKVGILSRALSSPTVWMKKNLREAAASAQRLDQAQARLWNQFIDLQRIALKEVLGPVGLKGLSPSGRKQLAELDQVLLVGDEMGEVFSARQLRAGVNGIKLSAPDKQIPAYFKLRKLIDDMHVYRNQEVRNEHLIRGNRTIHINDSVQDIGRPYAEANDAGLSLAKNKPNEVYDATSNTIVPVNSLKLEDEYLAGKQLVKLNEASALNKAEAGSKWQYVLVNADDISDLPMQMVNYRKGYVPKINLNTNYFVKQFSASKIDGVEHGADSTRANVKTIRAFDNRADAEQFAKQMQEQDPTAMYRSLEDRQIEKEARFLGDESLSTGGGLFTGARAHDEILFGLEGNPLERLSAFESISRGLGNLSRYIPRNTWRMGMEQKAINTANALLPNRRVTKFQQLAEMPDTQEGRFLKKLHAQIEDWLGFPSAEERLWESTVQEIYETAFVQKMPNFAKNTVQYVKHKDPIAAARAGAFHSLLGWFNPVQLFVQAQGAVMALSSNIFKPVELARVMRNQTALAAAMHMDDPKAIRHVAKSFGMDADELIDIKRAWDKTGLQDSILQTADHAAAMRGRGVGMDALSRASDKGLLFYRMGEMFNRRTSFVTAYSNWKKANKGQAVSDQALKNILSEANNYMLNLGKANRATWQKGILGLPTQFLQVSTKTLETLLGMNGHFDAATRGRMIIGQLGMYGAAGVPLGSIGANLAAQWLGYKDQAEIERNLPPETRKAINEGFIGWATMAAFGLDIDVGQRLSLWNGINEFTDRMLFGDTHAVQMLLGAFGTTGKRFWDEMTSVFEPVSWNLAGIRDVDFTRLPGVVVAPIASWRNGSKALFMHNLHRIVSSRNETLIKRDFKLKEEIAQMIGFRLSDEVIINDLESAIQAKEDYVGDIGNEVLKVYWDYALAAEQGDLTEDYKEKARNNLATFYQLLPTNADRMKVQKRIEKSLSEGEDKLSRSWQRYRRTFNDGKVGELLDWHSKLVTNGILQERSVED